MCSVKVAYKEELGHFRHRHKSRSIGRLAVVIHLFYTENWPLFRKKLLFLKKVVDLDIYLTIPRENKAFMDVVWEDFPDAEYLVCPNRGRDVLPFIQIARELQKYKYISILKFHSKKSTHWDGGQDWLEHTLDQIIPEDEKKIHQIIKLISEKSTGVIGPSEYYYPLTVNFPANGMHMSRYVKRKHGTGVEREYLQINRGKYGFFGGTMMWLRIDAISNLLTYSSIDKFEEEAGQVDGTYAHTVERLISLIPQLDHKRNYESDGRKVTIRPYQSDNIPDWSTDHEK